MSNIELTDKVANIGTANERISSETITSLLYKCSGECYVDYREVKLHAGYAGLRFRYESDEETIIRLRPLDSERNGSFFDFFDNYLTHIQRIGNNKDFPFFVSEDSERIFIQARFPEETRLTVRLQFILMNNTGNSNINIDPDAYINLRSLSLDI